ncbi:MAG: hypothetical protein SPL79_10975 [Sphaerochaetaceae bacterium]|nr:hypothetical protein [Sphaerochaetaceae bacterium]
MRKALMMLGLVSLLGFAGCNMDLYTSEFKDQQVTTVDESLDNGFDGSNPVFLSATKGAYTDRISLSWTKVTGADYYVVERAPEGSDEYQELPETVMGTSYDDVADTTNPIVAGRRYSYRVYARSYAKKAESGSQATARAVGSILTVPESVAADKGKNSDYIMVSWSPVVDATAYKVYVKGTNSASYTLAGTASGSQTRFRYLVGENEQGQELYFKVSSVGSNNAVTGLDDGTYAIGFSLVAGAPSSPTNLVASQGKALVYSTSKKQMQLTWDKADSGTTGYQIYRSAPGENEEQIYPYGSSDDTLDMSGTDTVTFTDKRGKNKIVPGVRYTYTVIPLGEANGETIKGSPATVDGYLLSNPSPVTLSLKKYAYVVSFPQAVGLDTSADRTSHSGWTYLINAQTANGAVKQVVLKPGDYTDSVVYEEPYDTSGAADDQYTMFSVQVSNGSGLETVASESQTIAAPGEVAGLAVSQNRFESGMVAANGIYPVRVTWTRNTNIDHYVLTRYDESGTIRLGNATIDGSLSSYDDVNDNAEVGVKYSYTLQAYDVLGREGALNDPTKYLGYGALTGTKFIEVWSAFAFKPFAFTSQLPTSVDTDYQSGFNMQGYWNSSSIKSKVDKGNSSSLSTQMDALTGGSYIYNYCHFLHGSHTTGGSESHFGTIGYSAATEGIGGQIYFSFSDFGEVPYMYTNGEYEMHVDSSGTGSAKSGTGGFTVSGMYPAVIGLGNITVKGKAFSGQYSVRMRDGQGTLNVTAL